MEVKEIVKKKWKNPAPEKMADEVKKLHKEHSKLVKGMFEFVDAQGGWIDFTYRFFKDEPIQQIRLIHGEICELPIGIIKHLNNTYKKVRQFAASSPDKAAELTMRGVPSTVEKTSRLRFTPMDMM